MAPGAWKICWDTLLPWAPGWAFGRTSCTYPCLTYIFAHLQKSKYQLWANCFMRWVQVLNRGPQNLRDTHRDHCCSQCLNHSAITSPSTTDWHQLSVNTHWLQQRVDSGQERFSTGMLTPGTGVEISFWMKET